MPFDLPSVMASLDATARLSTGNTRALGASAARLSAAQDAAAARRTLIMRLLGKRAMPPPGALGSPDGRMVSRPTSNPPGRGLVQITAPNGQRVTVAGNYAGRFSGLLSDLWNAGYKFKSVQGYNYRNIAGTNTLSKHATGEAIDIDPQPNRGNRLGGGGSRYGYFDPSVINGLIRKWNLDWGGTWSNPDPMHFSTGG